MAVTGAVDKVTRLLQQAVDFHRAGNLDSAEKEYRRVLKLNARHPDALHLLGLIAEHRGNLPEAARLIDQALAYHPEFINARFARARIANAARDFATAEVHLRRALQQQPGNLAERLNLESVLINMGRIPDAIAWLLETTKQYPTLIDAYVRLGRLYRMLNDADGMLTTAKAGLKQDGDQPILHLLASEAHFERGELKDGWHEYRWRFKSTENRVPDSPYALPVWQGEGLGDRRLLIWTEQAPGDEILYANMLSDLIRRAKACALQCSPRLAPLFKRSFPGLQIYDHDLTPQDCAHFDLQTSIASAAEWLRADFAAFPRHQGYLTPDQNLRARCRAKYEAVAPGNCVVGIAWRSLGVENAGDKSVTLSDWGPVLKVPGVTFVNLQYGDCTADLAGVANFFGTQIIQDDEIDPLKDIDSYAAQVAAMDLVVSSSNTAVHVAGALGVPVMCMLPMSLQSGRRAWWFASQPTCVWYPALRWFFQREKGQWLDVLRDVGLALLDFAVAHGAVPKTAPYLRSMAGGFTDLGRLDDAAAFFQRLAQEPGLAAEAYFGLGNLRKKAGDADTALAFFDQALAADPSFWHAYNGKGMVLANAQHIDDAVKVYEAGLTYAPTSIELHNNLGTALRRLGKGEEALAHFQEAHRLKPEHRSVHLSVASQLDELGRADEAIASFDALIEREPDYVDARYNRAQALLSIGRFVEGWTEFIWRLQRAIANVRYEAFPQARWEGQDITGKNILIWTEQGIGDEIMTASMVPDAIAKARHVTLVCTQRLLPIMRRSFPQATIVERKEPLPPEARRSNIAWQLSQADLGLIFRRQWSDFPQREGFLKADPARQAAFRAKYQKMRPGHRLIGISWRSSNHELGWLKGQDLRAWAPILTGKENVSFVNLQYGDCRQELERIRAELGVDIIHDPDVDPLEDMDAFAAQVGAMDLVISTSNTTVHVGGALGVPTWVLLPGGRGRMWYWFRERSDSPWYSALVLLRQIKHGDWATLFAHCGNKLAAWLREPRE